MRPCQQRHHGLALGRWSLGGPINLAGLGALKESRKLLRILRPTPQTRAFSQEVRAAKFSQAVPKTLHADWRNVSCIG